MDDDVGDELLGLIFTACHPVLSAEARAALTLRLIGGLTTDEIARAFLSSEADDRAAHRAGQEDDRRRRPALRGAARRGAGGAARFGAGGDLSDLQRGLCGHAGDDLIRPALCAEAQRLGRILAGLMPEEPEVFGLLALMEIQASRLAARTGAGRRVGAADRTEPRPLGPAADPPRPCGAGTRRGAGRRRRALCAAGRDRRLPCPARRAEDTDWPRIAALYDTLRAVMPSPVVDLNRAVAYSMAFGPEAGLALVDEIAEAAALRNYAPLPAARGDFLFRAGRLAEAQGPIRGRGRAHPQRPRAGLPAGAGGGLRRLKPRSATPCMGLSKRCTFTGVTRGL